MSTFKLRIDKKRIRMQELQQECKELEEEYISLCKLHCIDLDFEQILKKHIENLKTYNELKDIGFKLVQLISLEKRCKEAVVFEEMGYDMKD